MRALLIFLAATIGGCQTYYRQPPATAPSATFIMQKPPSGAVSFLAFGDAACTRTDGMGLINALADLGVRTKSQRLPADKLIYILASGTRVTGTVMTGAPGVGLSIGNCANLFSFVPVAGHEYGASLDQEACVVRLLDARTNRSPESMQPLPIPKGCGGLP